MAYAFPRAFAGADKRYPALASLAAAVAKRPNLARYLASERRIPFNEFGRLPALSGARSVAGKGGIAQAMTQACAGAGHCIPSFA